MKREDLEKKIWFHFESCKEKPIPTMALIEKIMCEVDEYTDAQYKELENPAYTKPKGKSLEERKLDFVESLVPYGYSKDCSGEMMQDFIEYWTEHNEGGKKMRFEMSKNQPFNIKRRLATWAKNQKKFNNGTTTSKADSANEWLNS